MIEFYHDRKDSCPGAGETPASPEEQLWSMAFTYAEQKAAIEAHLDQECTELAAMDPSRLSWHEREDYYNRMRTYSAQFAHVQMLSFAEQGLLNLLDRMSSGEVSEEEVSAYLPQQEPEGSQEEPRLSKRKLALLAELAQSGIDPRNTLGGILGWDLEHGADPGRLTTGRHQRRVTFSNATDATTAEHDFFFRTADTHGGKTRSTGKKGRSYIGSSGKRIRKR